MTSKTDKANKAAKLAIGEERLGNEAAAEHAGRTAGVLYKLAGLDLDHVFGLVGGDAPLTWNAIVDGWYATEVVAPVVSRRRGIADAMASIAAAQGRAGKYPM